ncbi:MAG: tRNA pseudouridine32 synthase/23S rRNA pseudouridine746 synthase [Oleiphilaceae bacterium]|jgi:tRNA pseudouridine32 synthase/23S rRNA pseudouridine746 synthase
MSALLCLFEDINIYVIHKPQDVPFHSLDESVKKDKELVHVEGIVSLAKKFLNDDHIFPVHRLDRMTSGLMIFARSQEANSELSKLFLEKRIEKYYLALSEIKPKKKQGSVMGDMAKGRSGSYLLKRSHENPAITRFFTKKIAIILGMLGFIF